MPTPRNVAVIVGSLRKESLNRKMALVLAALAPPSLQLDIIEIGQLPLYNQDLDAAPPPEWTLLRDRIRTADAVLFVTPEYNRSIPGVLKNAIDVGSRPYGKNAWNGKPAAIVSVSPGAIGGFGANHHLRQMLVFLNMPALPHEAYIGSAAELFDPQGGVTRPATRAFLAELMQTFDAWIERQLRG